MSLNNTDLLVVGRGVTSYHYSYNNFKTEVNAGLASESYVDNKVGLSTAGLASEIYVDNKVGLATAGLASEIYVDNKVGLSTAGLASEIYVDNKVGLATAGLASEDYVDNVVGLATVGLSRIPVWTLGADGTNNYTFTGPGLTGAEDNPTITLARGQKYNFVNDMGSHPFTIQRTPGETGSAYNDGIINNGVTNGTLEWDVQFDAPDTLYYQCTTHPSMQGTINVLTNADLTGLASESYVDNKVGLSTAGLASEIYVDNKVGLATAGLASIIYVDNKVGLATAGLASIIYVDNKVGLSTAGLASEIYVDNKVGLSTAGLASEIYVDNKVGLSTVGLAYDADLQEEIINRQAADQILDDRITNTRLDDLYDVQVGGATTGQAVTWNGTNWIAETVTTDSPLTFVGSVDLTNYSTAPVITVSDAGDLYINTGIGTVDVGFGSSVTNSVTNAVSGELIAVNAVGAWQYFGTVGASGLSYDDFSAANINETSDSKGELTYNNITGQYTFEKVDLDSRIPRDISTLPILP